MLIYAYKYSILIILMYNLARVVFIKTKNEVFMRVVYRNSKKILLFSLILFVSIFALSNVKSDSTNYSVEEIQDALVKTAYAFYERGEFYQYDQFRENRYASPEDATSQNTISSVCSTFINQIYRNTFYQNNNSTQTILPAMPVSSLNFLSYASKYYKSEVNSYVDNDNTKASGKYILKYFDAKAVTELYDLFEKDENWVKNNWSKFLKPGDIFVVRYKYLDNIGHTMMVTDVSQDGKVTIIENNGSVYDTYTYTEKIEEDSGSGGSLIEDDLYRRLKYYNSENGDFGEIINEITLIRYVNDSKKYLSTGGNELTLPTLSNQSRFRDEYPSIYIEKTSSIYGDNDADISSVNPGDKIVYKIEIKNNSNIDYLNLYVKENIDYISLSKDLSINKLDKSIDFDTSSSNCGNVTTSYSEGVLEFNIDKIVSGNTCVLEYAVDVDNDINLIGKYVRNTGVVYSKKSLSSINVENASIYRHIENKLSVIQKQILKNYDYSNIKVNGLDFVNKLYLNALSLSLNITYGLEKNFNNMDLIKFEDNPNLIVKYTNINNNSSNISNMILPNMYGLAVYNKENPRDNTINAQEAWKYQKDTLNAIIYDKDEIINIKNRVKFLTKNMFEDGDVLLLYDHSEEELIQKNYIFLNNKFINLEDTTQFIPMEGENENKNFLNDINGNNYIVVRPAVTICSTPVISYADENPTIKAFQKIKISYPMHHVSCNNSYKLGSLNEVSVTNKENNDTDVNLYIFGNVLVNAYSKNKSFNELCDESSSCISSNTSSIINSNIDLTAPIIDSYKINGYTNNLLYVQINALDIESGISAYKISLDGGNTYNDMKKSEEENEYVYEINNLTANDNIKINVVNNAYVNSINYINENKIGFSTKDMENIKNYGISTIDVNFDDILNVSDDVVVTYNYNGGYGSEKNKIMKYNYRYEGLAIPVREGYIFEGWYLDEELTQKISEETKVSNLNDHSIYAKWSEVAIRVTFNLNGGNTDADYIFVKYGEKYLNLPTPKKANHIFEGWYLDEELTQKISEETNVSNPNDHSIYAKWSEVAIRVTFNLNGGNTDADYIFVKYGEKYLNLPTPKKANHIFEGWYLDEELTQKISEETNVSNPNDHSIYAKWSEVAIRVTFNLNGGNTDADYIFVKYGEKYLNLPTPKKANHIFEGWYLDEELTQKISEETKVTNLNDHSIYAKYKSLVELFNDYTNFKLYNNSLYNLKSNTDVLSNFGLNDNINFKIYNLNGNIKTTGIIYTGDIIRAYQNENLIGTYNAIVKGDVVGNGKVTINDVSKLYKFLKGRITMDSSFVKAGNVVDTDDEIKINDVSKLYKYVKERIKEL